MKIGAWTPCPRCGYTPETPEDQAKHLMASDHHFAPADLAGMSARVEQGLPLTFNPEQVEQIATSIRNSQGDGAKIGWFVLGCLALVAVVVFGLVFLLSYLTRR